MKKIYVLFALSVCNQLAAQNNFQKIGPPPPAIQIIDELEGLNGTAQGSADIDNDGDVDLLFTGQNPAGTLKANLYVNNGLGGYTLNTSTPFVGVYDGALAFFDADDDGDQDVIITGQDFSSYTAKLFINDGAGNFTQSSNFFTGVGYSAVSIADVDNDTDIDVLICGQANSGVKADLYLNDGVGNFTFNALASSTFTGVYLGTSEFGDIDSDGDQDLVLMGYGDNGTVSGMYTNNGSGVFTSVPTVFPPLNGCDIVFTDADGDSFLDIILTGSDPLIGATTQFYHNNG
ncbi:MAG: VCBS repeat-containing protein, partial [Fluviicola sp.]|nr:VCBS repeat-containing protein [Fluviicola sp.]